MSWGELHIAHPELVHGLWLWLVFVAGLILLARRGQDRLHRLVGPALEARLVERPVPWRRGLRLALVGLSGLLMIAALMRPQWGEQIVATPRVGAEIMIALDVSRSMLADDTRPSRLERAKAEISDLLAYLENDQVGLIAFAGRASILAPLTPDKSFLRLALDGAGPHSVARGGTRLAEPILRAIAGLGRPGPAQRALLLITDGEDHDSFALDAAKRAAAAGIKIITIGFGDEAGSEIHIRNPDDGSRTLVRDADGNPVVSRLNGELLREIALATDGAYVPAGTGVLDLASIYETHIARLTKGQLDAHGRTIRGELYPLFVGGALASLVAAFAVGAGRRRSAESIAAATASTARVGVVILGCALGLGVGLALAMPGAARAEDAAADTKGHPIELAQAAPSAAPASGLPTASAAPAAAPSPGPGLALPSAAPAAGPVPSTPPPAESAPLDPRTRFNLANERLAAGEAAEASALYREARRDATDDVELRYAASYNLGMAAVARADALEASKPEEALAFLHEAADWFREASAMQPDDDDPRHNLDVALRRALILTDAIARKSRRDVEGELDLLIESQRGRVAESAMLLEAAVRAGELAAPDSLRGAFDAAGTAQRELVADAESLADRVADEKAIVEAKPEAERTPEDALRGASLEGVLAYLDQGIERMGQTRRQLRQRSAERAYRRGAEALALLKRARDQLRDPVEQLGVLVGEVGAVARATSALASGSQGRDAAADPSSSAPLPAFLTPESVGAETAAVAARVGELAERFEIAAERAAQTADPTGTSTGTPAGSTAGGAGRDSEAGDPAVSEALREALTGAAPLVKSAGEAMSAAVGSVGAQSFPAALEAEGRAGAALAEAQELFFDLRELLAVAHETQAGIAATSALDDSQAEAFALRAKNASAFASAQTRNRGRASRLEKLLANEREAQLAALQAPDPQAADAAGGADANAPAAPPDPQQQAGLEARFTRAFELLAETQAAMDEAGAGFGGGASRAPDWTRVAPAAQRATDRLDALRMLFLSLLEQLQRLEREQVDLADRTRDAIALAAADAQAPARGEQTKARVAAIDAEQKTLETRAGAIADALLAQSQAMADAPSPAEGAAPSGPDADTLRKAADHVASAQLSMRDASATFGEETRPLEPATAAQTLARDELRRAIALLTPPPPEEKPEEKPPEDSQDPDQKQGESGSGEQDDASKGPDDEGSEEEKPGDSEQGEGEQPEPAGEDGSAQASEDPLGEQPGQPDPSQLLQGVRDREAERRDANERRSRAQRRSLPVEKDW